MTIATAKRWVEDTREMAKVLFLAADLENDQDGPFWRPGGTSWHVSRME